MIERTRSMKNFFRAVKLGTRHRFTLLGAIFCSLMVALFWGTALGGIVGMILAIPLTAFLVVVWRLLKQEYIREVL